MREIVTSIDDVVANIRAYARALPTHPALVSRMGMHPAWYAVRSDAGEWMFGPSKFIGYRDADADNYLRSYDRGDGKETEPALRQLFDPVPLDSATGTELRDAFRRFAAQFGKSPNANWRVSVPREIGFREVARRRPAAPISERIAFNPQICGGRPHIAGTRVRVSDIVAALGAGERIDDLLADFPYLSEADVYAALDYAAKAVDHRVLRAA